MSYDGKTRARPSMPRGKTIHCVLPFTYIRVGNWLRTSLCIRNSNLSELTYSSVTPTSRHHYGVTAIPTRHWLWTKWRTIITQAIIPFRRQCSLPQALVLVGGGGRRELEPEEQSLFYSVHFRRLLSGREDCNNKRSGVGGWFLKYTKTIPTQYVQCNIFKTTSSVFHSPIETTSFMKQEIYTKHLYSSHFW
jgi:hypothetical protein